MAEKRDKLCEMLESGELDAKEIARQLLCWLSENDCIEFAWAHGIELEDENESEEEPEIEESEEEPESDPAQPDSTSN
jgi:hypothetical protein